MNEIENEKLKKTVESLILKTKIQRKKQGLTQEDHANRNYISLSSVKKVEGLKCYDLKIIDKYIK